MTKKSFRQGVDVFFPKDEKNSAEEFENNEKKNDLSKNQKKNRTTKASTYKMDTEQLNLLKAIAFWKRQTATSILHEAIEMYFSSLDEKVISMAVKEYEKVYGNQDQ